MTSTNSNLLYLIESQQKTNSLAHAYLVFGRVDRDGLVKLLYINSPDILVLDEIPIKIDHIRNFIHWLYLKPHSSKLKMAFLYNIDSMKQEAANSLLKALEEAPAYAILILQAESKKNILPTILSRCQIIHEKKDHREKLPSGYIQSEKIAQMSVKERFDYTTTIIDDKEELLKILNLWEAKYRQDLINGVDRRKLLEQISRSKHLLLTNTSVKLLIENLLLDF